MILGTLAASLLGNLLTGKGTTRAGYGNKQGKGTITVGYGNKQGKRTIKTGYGNNKELKKALLSSYPLTNFEIEEHYENEPTFNGVYSRDNLPKTMKKGHI